MTKKPLSGCEKSDLLFKYDLNDDNGCICIYSGYNACKCPNDVCNK